MLGLPVNTEISKPLPKAAIYRFFDSKSLPRERFDNDISRISIVNELSPGSMNMAEGNSVKAVYVLHILLKRKHYDRKNIIALTRLIPQKMLLVLQYDDKIRLAVFYTELITSSWSPADNCKVSLSGLNLDTVWENIVRQVGNIHIEGDNSLEQQIEVDETRTKLKERIDALEKKCRVEKQPTRKLEMYEQMKQMEKELDKMN